jgi:hypothetical protein
MSYGQVNADVIGTSVAGSNLGAGNASIMKNRIINGAMVIDQRNAGASVTPINGQYLVDRFYAANGGVTGKYTAQQNAGSVTPPVGFSNYLGITSTSAYSISSTDRFAIFQAIEGYNTSDLGWGTANAKTVTLSFQVYSSLTGTFGGSIQNYAQTYSYPFSYSIPVANTWTTISITVAGPTSGTWVGATNGGSVNLIFSLGAGSTFSGTAGSWASADYRSATGATSVVGTNGATFYLTGVQLEVGSSATGFEYRQYGQELQLCQRYYQTTASVVGSGAASTQFQGCVTYGTPMRIINPTFNLNTVLRITDGYSANPSQSSISFSVNQYQNNYVYVQFNNFTGLTVARPYQGYGLATTDTFTLSAEL